MTDRMDKKQTDIDLSLKIKLVPRWMLDWLYQTFWNGENENDE